MMMSLGLFVFSLPTLTYDELQRRTSWRHAQSPRVGAREANQYVGPGPDTITLSGTLLPEAAGDPHAFDTLREMGDQGEAWALVDGAGRVYGAYVLDDLDERQSHHFSDGVPRKSDFAISLRRVDDAQGLAQTATTDSDPLVTTTLV